MTTIYSTFILYHISCLIIRNIIFPIEYSFQKKTSYASVPISRLRVPPLLKFAFWNKKKRNLRYSKMFEWLNPSVIWYWCYKQLDVLLFFRIQPSMFNAFIALSFEYLVFLKRWRNKTFAEYPGVPRIRHHL